ncbi:MAG: hypothetical protein HY094_03010 [Candidatus Melainabacteria bacterium]|nr:hypothetical protein [Candidatus Melainabacteria bacterium]
MKNKFLFSVLALIVFNSSFVVAINAQETNKVESNNPQNYFPTANQFSYNLQRYTGLNCFADFLAETSIEAFMKLKTKAKKTSVDLKIYSAWDLLRGKAKYLNISADKPFIKDIPLEKFELVVNSPIYFKRKRVVLPVKIQTDIKISLDRISEVLNNLPKWKKVFKELELPIPPFGTTRVALNDLEIKINETGLVQASSKLTSLVDPQSESIKMKFTGNLILRDKKLVVDNLQSEVEDIFTKDSDIGRSFSEFLEDLINPVLNFHKYEKKGLTIDNINLVFGADNLNLKVDGRLLPKNDEVEINNEK